MFLMVSRGVRDMMALVLASIAASTAVSVDDAILLYENGDIPGAIASLEVLVDGRDLSYDEQLRAWDRLGSAYFAMGDTSEAGRAYLELLKLDVHYDLSPRANPRLRTLLTSVRDRSMAVASVSSEPAGALVTLDDELLGVTPLQIDGLLGGEQYDISVYSNGFQAASMTLTAVGGSSHDVAFNLIPMQETTQVALLGDTASASGVPDFADILASTTQQVDAGSTQPQVSTADLVNILTSGGGFDMAALASSGALSGQRQPAGGIAGAERVTSGALQTGLVAAAASSSEIQSFMVFSDTTSYSDAGQENSIPGSSRTSEEIMEVLGEKRSNVTFVYNKYLRNDPMLMGTVVVEMIIEPSGRVSDVSIIDSNTYNPAFELELARTIETWRFGAVDESESPLTVQYPFTFSQ